MPSEYNKYIYLQNKFEKKLKALYNKSSLFNECLLIIKQKYIYGTIVLIDLQIRNGICFCSLRRLLIYNYTAMHILFMIKKWLPSYFYIEGANVIIKSNTVKPAYMVTSIKQSPVLNGHFFLVPS